MLAESFIRSEQITVLAVLVGVAVVALALLRCLIARRVPRATLTLQGDGRYDYGIAGVDEHQPVLGHLVGRHVPPDGQDCTAELLPDLSRVGELRAIWVMVDGRRVGHIQPAEIQHFHVVLGDRAARCDAVVVPSRSGHLSVKLDTVWPPRLG